MPLLTEPTDSFAQCHGRWQYVARRMKLGHDRHVVALDVLAIAPTTLDPKRAVGETHPDPGHSDDEEEAGRDGVQGFGAEGPGGDVDPETEREDHTSTPGEH
jgi:hypothetical protein